MASNATATAAKSLPPVRLDPTQGSSPSLGPDPWSSFQQAGPPITDISQVSSLSDIREQALAAPTPAPATATPTTTTEDPWAGFQKAETADPWAGFQPAGTMKGYDLTRLKATKVDDLVKDKAEFNPVEFYAKNTDALLKDPAALDLVEKAYEQREKEKMTAREFFLKANPIYAILHPIEAAKTAGKIIKGGAGFIKELGTGVGQVFATGGEVAGNISTGDLKGASKGISEAADAFDAAQQHWVTTITSKLLPRPDNIRERLAYDAEFKRRELAAAAGNGELARALGTDQEGLKASGVTLDTNAIQKLSVIEDPMFLVPVGSALGVVSKGGRFLLGKAASPEIAEAFAKTINGAFDVAVGGAVEGGVSKAGKALEKIGAAIEKSPNLLSKVGQGAVGGTVVHALSTGNVAALASTLAAPIALKYTGKAAGAIGRGFQTAAPVAGQLAIEGAKGAAEGAVLATPLFIGSTPEERNSLLGMVGGAGILRAGGTAVGLGADVAARTAQEKFASKIYEPVNRGPVKESLPYGTDLSLDSANAEHSANLPQGELSVLNWAREFFRPAGIEVYALDTPNFTNHVPKVAGAEFAEGFFLKRGERINPDGTRQPVVQILLNKDTNGLGHELYHAFKSLDPQGATALESHISKTWTPEEQTWIADTYNAALNGGKPKSQWTQTRDKNQILEEAAAEVFGRVLNATDLSGVRPSVVRRASEFAGRALEKMGYPLAGKALPSGPGVSALGVRPGAQELKISRDFLSDITRRVQDGSLGPSKPGGPGLPEAPKAPGATETSRAPVPAQTPSELPPAPATPQPATPPPPPAPPVQTVPEAPNIRVTPKEQADFAADRAKVTNAEQALKVAPPEQAPHVQAINDSMAAGHAVEIVHKGVIREGGPTPEKPVARGERRAEQEAAYVAEAAGAIPDSVREPHQKVFFATRWLKGGKQLTARSLDKALANAKNAVDMAAQTKTTLPYEVDAGGKLTEAGWSEVVQDLKDYWSNQDRGFRGDGQALAPETRTRDIGQSLPPEDPRGPAAIISPERTDFLNLIQGLNIPKAVTRQTKGVIPGNVKGQLLAEAQGRKPAAPSRIAPEDVQRQAYKPIEGIGVRSIAEVNPLRNDLRAKGAPVDNLIEVTENINRENIESVTPRPDISGRGGSTDITRAGFSVNDMKAEVARRLEEKRKSGIPTTERERLKTQREVEADLRSGKKLGPGEAAGFFSVRTVDDAKKVLDMSPKEWTTATREFKDGLTPEAYRLGLGLKDRADLDRLAEFQKTAEADAKTLISSGDFEAAMPAVTKAQFFREAWEAAQGIKSARGGMARSPEFKNVKPPFAEPEGLFSPAARFEDKLDPIDKAAIRTQGGHVVTGSWHGEALDVLANQIGRGEFNEKLPPMKEIYDLYDNGFLTDGFVTKSGKFLTREEALQHAQQIGQLKQPQGKFAREGILESDEFAGQKSFSLRSIEPDVVDKIAKGENGMGETFDRDGSVSDIAGKPLHIVTLASRDVPRETLTPNRIAAAMKYYQGVLNLVPEAKVGVFNLERKGPNGEPMTSIDLNVAVDKKFSDNTLEFARKNNQESVWDAEAGKVVDTGGSGHTPLRSPEATLKAARKLVEGKMPEFIVEKGPSLLQRVLQKQPERIDVREAAREEVRRNEQERADWDRSEKQALHDMGESFSVAPTDKQITEALSEDKKPFVGAARDLEPGTPVGLRIDIPAYNRTGTYVITVHEKAKGGQVGKRIGYDSVATVDNPTFFSNEKGALKIKEGAPKFPIATVEGEFNPSREIPKAGGDWTEIGFNPTKHSYFYEKGTEEPVVGGSQAVSVGNSVLVKDAKFGNKEDFAFSASPEEERIAKPATGAHVTQTKVAGTPEFNAYTQNKIDNSKNFPEAFPLEFRQDKNGNYEAQWDGEPLPKARPYNLLKSDLAEKSGSKEKFRDALAEKLVREYHKAKQNPEIAEGEHWYSTFRDKVGKVLGDDTKLFAELLGATSPQQAVGPNFKDALGAYNQYKSGAYDAMLEKYREGKVKFANGDIAEFTEATGKKGKAATKEAFLNWWQKKHDLYPKKANGKKFGMNSRSVLKVFDRSWLEGVQGPKTPNFTGNLSGTTFKATIDVWAMRSLSRLAGEDSGKPWRIQPANETGVTDPEFFFGQEAFQKAADDLGIKADGLQAIIWFAEKDLWEKNGWTGAAGKAKSDYNTLLDRTTKTPEGKLHFQELEVKPKSKKKKETQLELGDVKKK